MSIKVSLFDWVTSDKCPKCGSTLWIVDGIDDETWLLCADPSGDGCVETTELPADFEVVE